MTSVLENFTNYQNQMVEMLRPLPDVLGLMFAGSAADLSRVDSYSDQDFYLVVRDGTAEGFRQDLGWLPRRHEIVLSPRETEHGLKVLYKDGTLLEFAVFEIGELPQHMAPRDNRVAFDRGGIAEVIASITKHSPEKPFDSRSEYELFLTQIQIGAGRVLRGEVLAGTQHIKGYALNHLLGLIRNEIPGEQDSSDFLNRYRRFENDYPDLGKRLSTLIEGPALRCARGMVEIAASLAIAKNYSEQTRQVVDYLVA
jgi:hypothetical protein